MADHKTLLEDVIVGLYNIGAVKFGDFKLRSGVSSPVYIDLRSIVAYPELLKNISELVWLKVQSAILPKVDPSHRAYVCGVPYSALTIATSLCVNHSLPSLIVRKEAKVHGTKKLVEGILEDGKKNFVIVVEDVVTSGISISETVDKIKGNFLNNAEYLILTSNNTLKTSLSHTIDQDQDLFGA